MCCAARDNDQVCFGGCFFVDNKCARLTDCISLYRTTCSRDRPTSGEKATCNDMLQKNMKRIVSSDLALVRGTITVRFILESNDQMCSRERERDYCT
jgi:hypothetical protein